MAGYVIGTGRPAGVVAPAGVAAAPASTAVSATPTDAQVQALHDPISREPGNAKVQIDLGNVLYDAGRYQEAIGHYQKALELDPKNVRRQHRPGDGSVVSGPARRRAGASLRKSLAIEPNHPQTLFNIGIVRLEGKQDRAGAIEAWSGSCRPIPAIRRPRRSEHPSRRRAERLRRAASPVSRSHDHADLRRSSPLRAVPSGAGSLPVTAGSASAAPRSDCDADSGRMRVDCLPYRRRDRSSGPGFAPECARPEHLVQADRPRPRAAAIRLPPEVRSWWRRRWRRQPAERAHSARQAKGHDAFTLPAAKPITSAPRPVDAPPQAQAVAIDAVPLASGPTVQVGLPDGLLTAGSSPGPGSGGGVGTGTGTGIGSGHGPGMGPGVGGGTGGGVTRPAAA